MDTNHYHHEFTNSRIIADETVTHFLKRFTIGHTKAIIANNTYSEEEIVDYFLAALHKTTNIRYLSMVQHYLSEQHNAKTVLFHNIERRLLAIDKTVERDTYYS